jgi:predicted nucleic acid-binding protein
MRTGLDRLRQCPIGPREWRRALDVFEVLARQGGTHHRRVQHPDLLIAAAAESADMPVLHYDSDFDVIAAITGQPTRWIAPRGSL